MVKLCNVVLSAQVAYRRNTGRVRVMTDYRIMLGDMLVGHGTVAGYASEQYLLKNFSRLPGFRSCEKGMELAKACQLV